MYIPLLSVTFSFFFKIKHLLNEWSIYIFHFPRRDFISEACERRTGPHHLQPVLQNPVNTHFVLLSVHFNLCFSRCNVWFSFCARLRASHKSDLTISARLIWTLTYFLCASWSAYAVAAPNGKSLYMECACSHVCRTVLLMNPNEVPAEFLSVAKQLTCIQHSQKDTYITLIKHAFQSTLGTKYPLHHIHTALQVSTQSCAFPKARDIFASTDTCFKKCFGKSKKAHVLKCN